MITQLGCPTIFFTLSADDTKWPDLHKLMPFNGYHDRRNEVFQPCPPHRLDYFEDGCGFKWTLLDGVSIDINEKCTDYFPL